MEIIANPGMTETALQFGCLWLNKNLQPLVTSTRQMFIFVLMFFFPPKTTATLVVITSGCLHHSHTKTLRVTLKVTAPRVTKFGYKNEFLDQLGDNTADF